MFKYKLYTHPVYNIQVPFAQRMPYSSLQHNISLRNGLRPNSWRWLVLSFSLSMTDQVAWTTRQLRGKKMSRISGLCNECIRTVTDIRILQHSGLTADGLRGIRLVIYIGMLANQAELDMHAPRVKDATFVEWCEGILWRLYRNYIVQGGESNRERGHPMSLLLLYFWLLQRHTH